MYEEPFSIGNAIKSDQAMGEWDRLIGCTRAGIMENLTALFEKTLDDRRVVFVVP